MSMKQVSSWKNKFASCFLSLVEKRQELRFESLHDAFRRFQENENEVNTSFWKEMGQQMEVAPKKLHDYFHNTWSRQFCDKLAPFK